MGPDLDEAMAHDAPFPSRRGRQTPRATWRHVDATVPGGVDVMRGEKGARMDAREHRWRLRLCAGLAVLATIGSLGVAAWLAGRSPSGRPPAVQTSDPAPRPLDLSALPPARQIWPAAVRTLPAHLPDGQAGYTVQAALPGDRYLVSYPGATGMVLAAFDTERATVTVLSTPTAYLLAGVPTVAGDRVTWVVAGTDAGGRPVAEIWVGSTAGGAPVRVARLTGADAGGVHRAWTVCSGPGTRPEPTVRPCTRHRWAPVRPRRYRARPGTRSRSRPGPSRRAPAPGCGTWSPECGCRCRAASGPARRAGAWRSGRTVGSRCGASTAAPRYPPRPVPPRCPWPAADASPSVPRPSPAARCHTSGTCPAAGPASCRSRPTRPARTPRSSARSRPSRGSSRSSTWPWSAAPDRPHHRVAR